VSDDAKSAARKAAFARRKVAHDAGLDRVAQENLARLLSSFRGRALAGYMPIRSEISPLPVMAQMAAHGPVCVPVITEPNQPLMFHQWTPDMGMIPGAFGALVPVSAMPIVPQILIVPLVAYDLNGGRLGYGGGYYDRTLDVLRAVAPTVAVGFAHSAQQTDALPQAPTDQPLDMIVTERGVVTF
jgi:5-formyltetrahydrofolate cyclo-ligase